jgi:hypothetical protein
MNVDEYEVQVDFSNVMVARRALMKVSPATKSDAISKKELQCVMEIMERWENRLGELATLHAGDRLRMARTKLKNKP